MKNRLDISNKFKKSMASLLLGASLLGGAMGLQGCATTGYDYILNQPFNQEGVIWDKRGEWMLITENNDIYICNLDQSVKERLTDTPDRIESGPKFTYEGKYITYRSNTKDFSADSKFMLMRLDGSNKKEISSDEYYLYTPKQERGSWGTLH